MKGEISFPNHQWLKRGTPFGKNRYSFPLLFLASCWHSYDHTQLLKIMLEKWRTSSRAILSLCLQRSKNALSICPLWRPTCVFRSAPLTQSKEYLAGLNIVESKKQKQHEDLDISNMIQISRTDPRYNPTMLLASIFFWEGPTNTF